MIFGPLSFKALKQGARMCSNAPGKLSGKVAIVTASTAGIGFAIARKLGQDGAKVIISSRKQANVDKALDQLKGEGLTVSGMVCHVGKGEHRKSLVDMAVKEFGGLDILVSNAAVNPYFGLTLDCPEQAWDKILDINIKAAALLVKEAVPHLSAKGNGNVVIVSSIAGYQPMEVLGAYSVSKSALLGLTKVLSSECASMGIRVNGIAPGIIETKFSEAIWKTDSIREAFLPRIPMRRFGLPEECAGAVSFLCSDDATYITGETLVVSGGLSSRL